jgi:hypothetical protein
MDPMIRRWTVKRTPEAALTILRLLLACGMICHEEQELVRQLIRGEPVSYRTVRPKAGSIV